MNLVEPILRYAARYPDKVALSYGRQSLTYGELAERIKKVAWGLRQNGLKHDMVAILSGNRLEFVEVFLGAVYAGCVPVPMDPKWSAHEINAVMRQCRPKMIFAENGFPAMPCPEEPDARLIVFSGDSGEPYAAWIDGLEPQAAMDDTNAVLFLAFTSGTTGTPKGYMRTHQSWIKSLEATEEAFQLDMRHISAPGPLVHSLSLFALVQSLCSGATFHLVPSFDAGEVWELCARIPDVILFVVPTMIEAMMREPVCGRPRIQALISSGGKWPEASKKRSREIFGEAKLYEYYGSSEASYISYLDVLADQKPDSVGKPFSGVDISIRDERFKELPPGQIGQLYVRSEMAFLGYHQLPEETAAVFRDGWLKLGDYAYMDQEGYLYLAGRAKNMIVSGGLNIFPEEIESVLLQLPAVEEAMVLGLPDEYWGERVTVLVKWSGRQRMSIDEIKSFCRRHLAAYKAPKQLITVERFMYTGSGKIARQAMKDYAKRVMS
ncbi:AMP-binding protein [Paenibacillus sp. VCA1]|uniref:class I adenylate-forming enzyme family protein n=1 Tax=Paenibacillus sp. VCA1 TaxID=3039148 RepID=UPI00287290FB|nr:AMP-binding protein [Paenibacillus sp. VCA1]MDR9853988.1 AMP-binding protein [Paenibacillus sp. VCA1]